MKRDMGTTVALGLGVGTAIGAALHFLVPGMPVGLLLVSGMAVGLLFGAALGADWTKRKKA